MAYTSREKQFRNLFPAEPAFRWKQVQKALFDASIHGWKDASTLPNAMRETLHDAIPWMSFEATDMQESVRKDTFKALIRVEGGKDVETVLMRNRRDQWTICVSSQVGCAMRCGFCATGKMGLTRSLDADEIVDQYRFWQTFLAGRPELPSRISNVVFMGMGEPLANYENVKATLNTLLTYTDLGKTRITVSTVGVLPRLEQILTDKNWPHTRLAISLHSADPATRKQIVPTSYDDFLPKLMDWAQRYLKLLGNRRHHLTFEYVMLKNVNDTEHHAKMLADFVKKIGNVRVNLIPYNFTGMEYSRSTDEQIDRFLTLIKGNQVVATKRKTMGDDIAAACGQLITMKGAA